MAFCRNCGNQMNDSDLTCSKCGTRAVEVNTTNTAHTVPKCTCCGYVGEMKPGPLLRGSDILWFCLLLFLACAGFIYLIYVLIIRANPEKREKICPHCKAKNMVTYVY